MARRLKKENFGTAPQTKPGRFISGTVSPVYWIALVLMILLTVVIRLRLVEIPLERDEGEFAYMGQLILQGIPPYEISYNMKLPGIYAAYALIMLVFGQTTQGIHLGFIIVNVVTIILMFLLGERLFDRFVGLIAACSFAILSLSPTLLGTSAHATHFVILFSLAGILLMLEAIDSKKSILLFSSGVLLGLSFLMKQPGLFFILFSLLYLAYALRKRPNFSFLLLMRQGSLFLMGALIPFAFTCAVLYLCGVFESFWFWTFSYALEYGTQIPFSLGFRIFLDSFSDVIGQYFLFWLLAAAGIGLLFRKKTYSHQRPFAAGFSLFSFLAVCPGLYFRQHYFVLLLPAVSLLIGICLGSAQERLRSWQPRLRVLPAILFAAMLLHAIIIHRGYFFQWTPYQVCRSVYSLSPFPESIVISDYVKNHSREKDTIAVIGSEPQIYFYANRHSATGYIYTYALMEEQKYAQQMQKEMTTEVEKAKPEYLVFVNVSMSWLIRPGSDKYIFRWFDDYSRREYDLVGVIELFHRATTRYRWGKEANLYAPQSPYHLLVFKRKGELDAQDRTGG